MVFLTGALIAVLMLYGQKEFLLYCFCIALIMEFLNITIMNKLLKSKESNLVSRHTQANEKLKKMLYKSQEREEELEKLELLQREEVAVLKRSLKERTDRLDSTQRTMAMLQEELETYRRREAGELESPAPPKKEPLTLF